MMNGIKLICLCVMAALILCGCNMQTIDDLYCLPIRSEEYTNLQSVIAESMQNSKYSAPLSGENQQTVQAADLDGDGEMEYLLFAKDDSEKPLKIFVISGKNGEYELIDTIACSGASFDKVEYIHMDARGGCEIVIGRQVSDQVVRSLSVYALVDGHIQQIMTSNYTQFLISDLDRNSKKEVFILRPGETGNGVAAVYSINGNTLERSQEVDMSEPAENIRRIMLGKLNDGVAAVYVASAVSGSDGIITDIYTLQHGNLKNVSLSSESGTSVQTLRNYYVYADDIDGDGVLELPSLINIKNDNVTYNASNQYIIRWYAMTSDGEMVDKMYTYHNFMGGWYLELDANIAQRITVSQMGSSYEFGLWDEAFTQTEKLMSLYVLTGHKREEQAVANNRFILHQGESTIYSASLEVNSAGYGLTKEALIEAFNLIQKDWITGET